MILFREPVGEQFVNCRRFDDVARDDVSADFPRFFEQKYPEIVIASFIGYLFQSDGCAEASRSCVDGSAVAINLEVEHCLPPPTMQTSTSSLSRSCWRGSNESFTSANLRHGVVESNRLFANRPLCFDGCRRHRRCVGEKCEYALLVDWIEEIDSMTGRLVRGANLQMEAMSLGGGPGRVGARKIETKSNDIEMQMRDPHCIPGRGSIARTNQKPLIVSLSRYLSPLQGFWHNKIKGE